MFLSQWHDLFPEVDYLIVYHLCFLCISCCALLFYVGFFYFLKACVSGRQNPTVRPSEQLPSPMTVPMLSQVLMTPLCRWLFIFFLLLSQITRLLWLSRIATSIPAIYSWLVTCTWPINREKTNMTNYPLLSHLALGLRVNWDVLACPGAGRHQWK